MTPTLLLIVSATLLMLLPSSSGLEIVGWSPSPLTAVLGETARLSCSADADWQWCYWQREQDGMRYQAFQVS